LAKNRKVAGNVPADVRAFDPKPDPVKSTPSEPTGFNPMRGKTSIPAAGSAPQPEMGKVAKGNPAKKHGLKHFSNPKTVNGGPTGTLPKARGAKDVIPEDVKSFDVTP
jgi:hypothetical protein